MTRYFSLLLFLVFINSASAQEILFQEDFNDCALPSGWSLTVSNGLDAGVIFGHPLNIKSDSISIDGTCMAIFDDDILGDSTPDFRAELQSPMIQAADYQTVYLRSDIHFRGYENSSFTVYLQEEDGTRIELRRFDSDDQTGTRFSEISVMSVDIRFVTESTSFSVVYVFDDAGHYGWWAGLDNVRVIGSGSGVTLIKEQFNDCSLPEGWTTNIIRGENEWQFGEVNNPNTSVTTMNGSCFAFFDDDGIGVYAPFSAVELITPVFDGSTFASFYAEFDLVFRPYTDLENMTVFVFDGIDYTLVKEFSDPIGGPIFNMYEPISLDLSPYRSTNMQVVFRYDDGNEYGWWVGIDNVKIIAEGEINDICTNADTLKIGSACIHSNNQNAVFEGPLGDCEGQLVGGLWYELLAPTDGIIKIENTSTYNDVISIFLGDCSTLSSQLCINSDEHGFRGEIVYLDVIANQSYYIRISGAENTYGLSKGTNCLSADYVTTKPSATIEDEIANAIPLILGAECKHAINENATIEDMIPSGNDLMRSDVWYSVNTGNNTAINIEVESDFAENITVFDSTYEEVYTHLRGGDFSVNELLENTDYYLQVGGVFSQIEGKICIQVLPKEEEEEAVADNCMDAMTMNLDTAIILNNAAQTFSGVQPSCEIYVGSDHWLKFNTLDNTDIYLTTESEYVQTISVFSDTCSALTEIWCTQQRDYCDGAIRIEGLQPQTDYYLQLSSAFTDNDEGNGLATIMLSGTIPLEQTLSLIVSVICGEDELAQLSINVITEGDYTLVGNTPQDQLFHGDSYTVVAQYADGCEKSVQGIVNCQSDDCNLKLIPFTEYLTCANIDDGSISLDITGGVGPYSYEWSHTTNNTDELTSLPSGIYTVKITDARACYIYQDIEILAPELLMMGIDATDETFANAQDGTAFISPSGGTLPYSIAWSTGSTESSVSNLSPGDYSVTLTDFNGCTNTKTFSVAEIDCAFAVTTEQTEITCFGTADAALSVGSTDVNIEAVVWSTGEETLTIINLAAGDYSVTVYADNGCNKIQQYTITEPQEIIITEDIITVSCDGEADGEISLQTTGGTGAINYMWENGSTEPLRSNLAVGNYQVSATDENGCIKEREIMMSSPAALDLASSMASDLSCFDSQDGILCAFVSGGTEPYIFAWDGTDESLSKVTDLNVGTYALTVTDVNGCSIETSLSINAPEAITVQLETMTIDGTDNGMIDITIEGGTAPYNVLWYLGLDVIAETEDIDGLSEGVYNAFITDANGCEFTSPDYILSLTAVVELSSSAIDVYPNPMKNSCTITAKIVDWNKYNIQLVDLKGQILYNSIQMTNNAKGSASCQINNVVSGIYYLQVERKDDVSISYRHAVMIIE